jgi:hypothetical protein
MTLKTYIDEKRGMLEPVILEFLKAKKESSALERSTRRLCKDSI